jgi:hypothetical protein
MPGKIGVDFLKAYLLPFFKGAMQWEYLMKIKTK